MSMRTPLGRVRGLGSAKSGTEHFWLQRVTAIATVSLVLAHVAERGGDTALRRNRVRAGREHLGDAGGAQAGLAAADHGAQAGAAGSHHDHVIGVILDRVGASLHRRGAAVSGTVASHRLTLRTTV